MHESDGHTIGGTMCGAKIYHRVIFLFLTYQISPFLVDGMKFDLRIYVLILGCDPLKLLIYKEGLVRIATEFYEIPNEKNKENHFKHLTNYAINKDHPEYEFNTDANKADKGNKRNLAFLWEYLKNSNYNPDIVWTEIKKLALKTLISVQPILIHNFKSCQPEDPFNQMCFEVLGLDVILDRNLKPFLLEVNHSPSFATCTPFDQEVKSNLINDTFTILNPTYENRCYIKTQRLNHIKEKTLAGKKGRLNEGETKANCLKEREEHIRENLGGYEYIWPVEECLNTMTGEDPETKKRKMILETAFNEPYSEFFAQAEANYHNFTGADLVKAEKKPCAQLANPDDFVPGLTPFQTNLLRVEKIYSGAQHSGIKKKVNKKDREAPNTPQNANKANHKDDKALAIKNNDKNISVKTIIGTKKLLALDKKIEDKLIGNLYGKSPKNSNKKNPKKINPEDIYLERDSCHKKVTDKKYEIMSAYSKTHSNGFESRYLKKRKSPVENNKDLANIDSEVVQPESVDDCEFNALKPQNPVNVDSFGSKTIILTKNQAGNRQGMSILQENVDIKKGPKKVVKTVNGLNTNTHKDSVSSVGNKSDAIPELGKIVTEKPSKNTSINQLTLNNSINTETIDNNKPKPSQTVQQQSQQQTKPINKGEYRIKSGVNTRDEKPDNLSTENNNKKFSYIVKKPESNIIEEGPSSTKFISKIENSKPQSQNVSSKGNLKTNLSGADDKPNLALKILSSKSNYDQLTQEHNSNNKNEDLLKQNNPGLLKNPSSQISNNHQQEPSQQQPNADIIKTYESAEKNFEALKSEQTESSGSNCIQSMNFPMSRHLNSNVQNNYSNVRQNANNSHQNPRYYHKRDQAYTPDKDDRRYNNNYSSSSNDSSQLFNNNKRPNIRRDKSNYDDQDVQFDDKGLHGSRRNRASRSPSTHINTNVITTNFRKKSPDVTISENKTCFPTQKSPKISNGTSNTKVSNTVFVSPRAKTQAVTNRNQLKNNNMNIMNKRLDESTLKKNYMQKKTEGGSNTNWGPRDKSINKNYYLSKNANDLESPANHIQRNYMSYNDKATVIGLNNDYLLPYEQPQSTNPKFAVQSNNSDIGNKNQIIQNKTGGFKDKLGQKHLSDFEVEQTNKVGLKPGNKNPYHVYEPLDKNGKLLTKPIRIKKKS